MNDDTMDDMGILNALNNRPIRVLGFMTAFHSLVYGVGYLTGVGGFDGALVGLAINSLLITSVLGAVLSVVGLSLMFAYTRMNPKSIYWFSYFQSLTWFFICLMYLINGAYLLSLGVGLSWSLVSGYVAYASKNRLNIMAYDQTPQAIEDTANEDKFYN